MKPVILASQSPRRERILRRLIDEFRVIPSEVDEDRHTAATPVGFARECARLKARAVAATLTEPALVLGADTIVVVDDEILGKPADARDAERMLTRLSGREHRVIGGIVLIDTATGREDVADATSFVTMRTIAVPEMRAYIAGGEPMDKAGAYAIQGEASKFVTGYTGELDNIIGLSTVVTRALLVAAGVPCRPLPVPVQNGKLPAGG